ncbi:MAG TPA: hypothetical protein VJ981_08375 [Gammaproteobacteria bacterium]|nr:hypothetical protein [Gammaproteobacteria bacterium]
MNKKNLNRLIYVLKSFSARTQYIADDHKIIALLASFHHERLKNLQPLLQSILKCQFISRVFLSNHNPDITVENWIKIKDERLIVLNQPVRHGPGYCWELAKAEKSDFYLLVDDDFLVTPKQIKMLIQHLIDQPEIPHGITGHSGPDYFQSMDMEVDRLSQIYAVTRLHMEQYFQYLEKIRAIDPDAFNAVEPYAHEIVMSRTGKGNPRIHHVGHLSRCHTARKPGVAIHKDDNFSPERKKVIRALNTAMSS